MKLFFALLLTPAVCFAWHGSVHVKGQLECNGKPYAFDSVQVWEHKYIGHEVWYEGMTDQNGNFSLQASGHEHGFGFSVYPYLWIPNYCGTKLRNGVRCTKNLIQIYIPTTFISYSDHPRVLNIGIVELLRLEGKDYNSIQKIFGYHQQCRSY